MIYRTEDIYSKIKNGSEITSETEFMSLLKKTDSPFTNEILTEAFLISD